MQLKFPSKGFTRSAMHALRDGDDLTIAFGDTWHRRLLLRDLKTLPRTKAEAMNPASSGRKFASVGTAFLLASFMTVHNYALVRGKVMSFKEGEPLEIKYA